jgi:hypothetical protein
MQHTRRRGSRWLGDDRPARVARRGDGDEPTFEQLHFYCALPDLAVQCGDLECRHP